MFYKVMHELFNEPKKKMEKTSTTKIKNKKQLYLSAKASSTSSMTKTYHVGL
jgi:hypothetical protein